MSKWARVHTEKLSLESLNSFPLDFFLSYTCDGNQLARVQSNANYETCALTTATLVHGNNNTSDFISTFLCFAYIESYGHPKCGRTKMCFFLLLFRGDWWEARVFVTQQLKYKTMWAKKHVWNGDTPTQYRTHDRDIHTRSPESVFLESCLEIPLFTDANLALAFFLVSVYLLCSIVWRILFAINA